MKTLMPTTTHIRYVAEPKHVREVTLTGTTDLGFWSDYLKSEGLAPVRYGDNGQIVIVAVEMAYMGLRFTEVSFSVRAAQTNSSGSAGIGCFMRSLRVASSLGVSGRFSPRHTVTAGVVFQSTDQLPCGWMRRASES